VLSFKYYYRSAHDRRPSIFYIFVLSQYLQRFYASLRCSKYTVFQRETRLEETLSPGRTVFGSSHFFFYLQNNATTIIRHILCTTSESTGIFPRPTSAYYYYFVKWIMICLNTGTTYTRRNVLLKTLRATLCNSNDSPAKQKRTFPRQNNGTRK